MSERPQVPAQLPARAATKWVRDTQSYRAELGFYLHFLPLLRKQGVLLPTTYKVVAEGLEELTKALAEYEASPEASVAAVLRARNHKHTKRNCKHKSCTQTQTKTQIQTKKKTQTQTQKKTQTKTKTNTQTHTHTHIHAHMRVLIT